jgi:hypothetical protein
VVEHDFIMATYLADRVREHFLCFRNRIFCGNGLRTSWILKTWCPNLLFVKCTIKVLRSTTRPNFDHCRLATLKFCVRITMTWKHLFFCIIILNQLI